MSRDSDIMDIAREASIAASENCRVAPQLLFAPIYTTLSRRLDSSAAVTHRPWFAWHPVRIAGGGWAWLRLVERRTLEVAGFSERWIEHEYRARLTAPDTPTASHQPANDIRDRERTR